MSCLSSPFARAVRVAVLLAGCAAATAGAQTLILRPAVVPLAGHEGQSVTQALTLQNESDETLDFTLESRDVLVRNGARVFVDAGKTPHGVAATAVFSPPTVHLGPHASSSVTATFTLPPGVEQRAVIAFFRGTTPVRSGTRKAVMSLGTLFTFTLSDRISIRAAGLTATPPAAGGNALITGHLVNDGNEPVVATGMAVILDAAGQLAGKAPFTPRRLLPGEALDVSAEYAGDLAPGTYRTVATFDLAGQPLTLSAPLTVQ